jgi:voltage-gated potassium channel
LDWFFTIIFTVEYFLRIICIKRPRAYIFSFFGVVDLMAILPSYLELMVDYDNVHYLAVIRLLRVLRLFRILKLSPYLKEANVLTTALLASKRKVLIFLCSVLVLATLFGSIMFLVEAGVNPQFSSIPKSIYWAIVTVTTVGYGDISPITPFGQFISAIVMILGYAIIAVPTGIVTVELNEAFRKNQLQISTQVCPSCCKEGHETDAAFCKFCGFKL